MEGYRGGARAGGGATQRRVSKSTMQRMQLFHLASIAIALISFSVVVATQSAAANIIEEEATIEGHSASGVPSASSSDLMRPFSSWPSPSHAKEGTKKLHKASLYEDENENENIINKKTLLIESENNKNDNNDKLTTARGCIQRSVAEKFNDTFPWLAGSRQTEPDPNEIWTYWMNNRTMWRVHVEMNIVVFGNSKLPVEQVGSIVNGFPIGTPDQGMTFEILLLNASNCVFFVTVDVFEKSEVLSSYCFDAKIPKWTKLVANNENSFASTKIFLLSELYIAVVEWPNANPTFVVPISQMFNDSEITVTSLLDASCRPINDIDQLYLIRGSAKGVVSEILLFTLSAVANVRFVVSFSVLFWL
jgi:hypothetical protein